MIVVHVAITTCDDYVVRREPYRRQHIERLVRLREQGLLIGGGPAPDGRSVELFYRVARPDQLGPLVEEDPYYLGRVWTHYSGRSFSQFVEPWEAPPVVLDGSRRVTVVEGAAVDPDMAQLALVELRGAGRLSFGGLVDQSRTVAVMRSADAAVAIGWLTESGFWAAEHLSGRPLIHVL